MHDKKKKNKTKTKIKPKQSKTYKKFRGQNLGTIPYILQPMFPR